MTGRHHAPEPTTGRVIVLLPAYNEADTIARTVAALRAQTRPPDWIIVLPNNCTDDTEAVAYEIAGDDLSVWPYPGRNPDLKAGALNRAIGMLELGLTDKDWLLVTDADSVLSPRWIEEALDVLRYQPDAGAVCASFYAEEKPGFLPLVQLTEFARFARSTHRRGGQAQVLSGVATILPVTTVRRVLDARESGELPGGSRRLYHTECATEDIELTFAVKALGYRPVAPSACWALTDALDSAGALVNQRDRWQRGMLDSLRLYGLRRWTLPYIARVASIYVLSLFVPLYLVFLGVVLWRTGSVGFDPRWLWVGFAFGAIRAVTVRRFGWKPMLVSALVLPEWWYEQIRSWAYWRALWKTIRNARRVWAPT